MAAPSDTSASPARHDDPPSKEAHRDVAARAAVGGARKAHPLRRALGQACLHAFGWEVEGTAPAALQAVVIAAPHTSNWDLVVALAVACALDIDIRWIGKHTLFEGPLGPLMRALGGVAVDRRGRHNAVAAVAEMIRGYRDRGEPMLLLVPPEGTRGRASRWKTGFYYIAEGAEVPIILGFLDYKRRRGGLGELFWPTGDLHADMDRIREFYSGITGKFPDMVGAITIDEEPTARG